METMAEPIIRTVRTENAEMEYFTFGQGNRPFLILPGLSLRSVMASAGAIMDAYAVFAEKYTVYVLDAPKDIPDGYTIRMLAEDTAAALSLLGVRGADVLGCSMGGLCAQVLAALRPDRVRKMVLAASAARPNACSRGVLRTWAELAAKGDVKGLNRLVAQKVYGKAFLECYAAAFAALENAGTGEEMRRFAILAGAVETESTWDSLRLIRAETLVIGSWDDAVFTGEASIELARALHCPLFLYTGYGHAVYDEAPDFKKRILDFLME